MSRVVCLTLLAVVTAAAFAAAAEPRPTSVAVRALGPALRWLAHAQRPDGGWNAAPAEPAPDRENEDNPTYLPEGDSDVPDTCMAAAALVRAGGSLHKPPFGDNLRNAVTFVLDAVEKSHPDTLFVGPPTMPLSPRLGNHIDTFLALQLLAQVQSQCDSDLRDRVTAAVEKLLAKLTKNQKDDGTWGTAGNAPMLGHALAVRALETASRAGIAADPAMIVKAEKWAMSAAAEKDEWKHNGFWRRAVPNLNYVGENPVSYETYLMAARLEVLAQADRTNMLSEPAVRKRFMGTKDPKQLSAVMRELGSIQTTHKTFVRAEEDMLDALPKSGSAGPQVFAGEDFLSTMFVMDALGPDAPKRCATATTAALAAWQKKDGRFDSPHSSGETVFCTSAAVVALLDAQKQPPEKATTRPRPEVTR